MEKRYKSPNVNYSCRDLALRYKFTTLGMGMTYEDFCSNTYSLRAEFENLKVLRRRNRLKFRNTIKRMKR